MTSRSATESGGETIQIDAAYVKRRCRRPGQERGPEQVHLCRRQEPMMTCVYVLPPADRLPKPPSSDASCRAVGRRDAHAEELQNHLLQAGTARGRPPVGERRPEGHAGQATTSAPSAARGRARADVHPAAAARPAPGAGSTLAAPPTRAKGCARPTPQTCRCRPQ